MPGKMFSFQVFEVFINFSVVLKGPCEILVLLVNSVNGILINLILRFPYSLISQRFFVKYYKSFVPNKTGCFIYICLSD